MKTIIYACALLASSVSAEPLLGLAGHDEHGAASTSAFVFRNDGTVQLISLRWPTGWTGFSYANIDFGLTFDGSEYTNPNDVLFTIPKPGNTSPANRDSAFIAAGDIRFSHLPPDVYNLDSAFFQITITTPELIATTYTYDQVRYVQAIPEPATVALLGLGLASFGFTRRRT